MKNHILHNRNWGSSAGGRDIEMWQNSQAKKIEFLFIGGVHGDEPEGVRLAIDLLNWLSKNHNQVSKSWALITCLNPDGFSKNQRTNDTGVDLNRNFPSSDWSASHWAPRYFPGQHAESEQEIKALVSFLKTFDVQNIFHFHSWQPGIVYTGPQSKSLAVQFAKDCQLTAADDIGYPTPGSLGQYAGIDLKIPTTCIEHSENAPLELVWSKYEFAFQNLVLGEK